MAQLSSFHHQQTMAANLPKETAADLNAVVSAAGNGVGGAPNELVDSAGAVAAAVDFSRYDGAKVRILSVLSLIVIPKIIHRVSLLLRWTRPVARCQP
jgi:hypothetical protein